MEVKKKSMVTQICHLSIFSSPFPFFLSYIQLLYLSWKAQTWYITTNIKTPEFFTEEWIILKWSDFIVQCFIDPLFSLNIAIGFFSTSLKLAIFYTHNHGALKSWNSLSYINRDIDPKGMATHSSTLAWRIPWREQPGRLQSMGSQRVGHDWATSHHIIIALPINTKLD